MLMRFLSFLKNVTPSLVVVQFFFFSPLNISSLLSYYRFRLTVQVKEIYKNLNFVGQRKRSRSTDHISQVAQAHYESPEQHYPTQLINYSYSKKIIRRCMQKYSLLTKLAKCTLNIALKLTFSIFLFFFSKHVALLHLVDLYSSF